MFPFIPKSHKLLIISVLAGVIVTYLTEGTWQALGVGMVFGAVSVDVYNRREMHRKAHQSQTEGEKEH